MVAADDEDADARLMQPAELFGQKPRRLHRGLVAIIEIAGQQQRVDLFRRGINRRRARKRAGWRFRSGQPYPGRAARVTASGSRDECPPREQSDTSLGAPDYIGANRESVQRHTWIFNDISDLYC